MHSSITISDYSHLRAIWWRGRSGLVLTHARLYMRQVGNEATIG